MRRQIRPFTIERKRGPRTTGADAPLLDLAPPPAPAPNTPQRPEVHRFAAAEALFSTPAPAAPTSSSAADSANTGKTAITGRILPSLVEPPAQHRADLADDEPRRRGRKPGSRNKAREPLPGANIQTFDPPSKDAQGPLTIGNVMRNLFEFWAAEDEQPAQTPVAKAEPVPARQLRRRSRIARAELPRAERWKARLPKFAR